jgi:hypothetical protein
MLVQLNSNGNKLTIKKVDFDKFSDDQKRNYTILSNSDESETKQTTTDTSKEVKPSKKADEPAKA